MTPDDRKTIEDLERRVVELEKLAEDIRSWCWIVAIVGVGWMAWKLIW